MKFFTCFCFLMIGYALLGYTLVRGLAQWTAPRLPFAEQTAFFILMALCWCVLYTALHLGTWIYHGRLMHREAGHQRLQSMLRINGCRWLNLLGGLGVVAAGGFLLLKGALPYTHWPAVLVLGIAFLDGFKPSMPLSIPSWEPEPFPEPSTEPVFQDDDLVREYHWQCPVSPSATEGFETTVHLQMDVWEQARDRERFPRRPTSEYLRYIHEGATEDVRRLAGWFRGITEKHGFDPMQEVLNVVAFVRALEYRSDEQVHGSEDWADFPVELLERGHGDCEDHAILATALLWLLGHNVGLIYLHLSGERDHMALGYHHPTVEGGLGVEGSNGLMYSYIETVPCDPESGVGDIAEEFLDDQSRLTVHPVGVPA